jgi:hypothetical protein
VRRADHLYTLRSHPTYQFCTGELPNGNQMLLSAIEGVLLEFSTDGDLLATHNRPFSGPDYKTWLNERLQEVPFQDGPIRVKRFPSGNCPVSIADLYPNYERFLDHPEDPEFSEEERRELPAMIEAMLAEGRFLLFCNANDYDVDAEGHVVGS